MDTNFLGLTLSLLWAAGKAFAICAWSGQIGAHTQNGWTAQSSDIWFQATGDPFVTK
jgi:hypothetical protein